MRHAWIEPQPWTGAKPKVVFCDSSAEPKDARGQVISPSPGGVVPAGYIQQRQADDGSADSLFQTIIPVFSGGPPAYMSPSADRGGSAPLPPNPAVGAGL